MIETDICVIGGGPAGTVAARQMAQLGYSVCLIERHPRSPRVVGESLARSIVPLFENLGLLNSIETAGFLRPRGARLRWESDEIEEIPHQAGGFLIDRCRFDDLLRAEAVKAGVRLICPANGKELKRQPDSVELRITRTDGDGGTPETENLRCRFLIDASGRGSVAGARRTRLFPKTLALCGHWQGKEFSRDHTIVESAPWGWAWGASLPSGVFSAIAFLDPEIPQPDEPNRVPKIYRRLIESLDLFAGCRSARLVSKVTACDASIRLSDALIDQRSIKAGEAASTLDPLSSQGVQAAIRSALQASTVVHTILQKPKRRNLAIKFFEDRQLETAVQSAETSAKNYRTCRRFQGEEFWKRRTGGGPGEDSRREKVAFKIDPGAMVRLSRDTKFEPTPVIEGEFVSAVPALSHPALARPVAYLSECEAQRLLQWITSPMEARELLRHWRRYVPEPVAFQILDWMWTRRILVPAN